MSKKLIAIVAAVVVVLGVGAVLIMGRDKKDTNNQSSSTSEGSSQQAANQPTVSGNIFSLADGGKATKCNFTFSGSNGESTGAMYSDGKGRGLMKTDVQTSEGNSGSMNVLVLGEKVYSWTTSNGQTVGFEFDKSVYQQSQPGGSGGTVGGSQTDPDQKFDLKCEDWNVDEAMLSKPEGITFTSLSGQTQ